MRYTTCTSCRFSIIGLFVLLLLTFIFYSCKKENLDGNSTSHLEKYNKLIEQAKAQYNVSTLRSTEEDTVEIFYALDLNWDRATVELKDSTRPFVQVPVNFGDLAISDTLSADLIFYEDSCGFSMELWIFPYFNTFRDEKKEHVEDGCVVVLNQCHWTTQIFYVVDGIAIKSDTLPIENNQLLVAQERFEWPKGWFDKVVCPDLSGGGGGFWNALGNFFGAIGTFFGNIGSAIGGFFGWLGNLQGSGGNGGGWSWSGLGTWSSHPGSVWASNGGGSGGTQNGGSNFNPQHYDPHVLRRATLRMAYTYGIDLDINILVQLVGIDCILSLGENVNSGNYLESECVEEALEDSDVVRAYFIGEFLSEYDTDIPAPILIVLSQNCPPIYGYEAFKNCLINEITTPLFTEFLQEHNQSTPAQAFITNILLQITQHGLFFLTMDDLNLLFNNPNLRTNYLQFLTDNPNLTIDEKAALLRTSAVAPSDPIENLSDRLSCFNITSNSNFTHRVTLCVDQPKANSNQSASSKDLAGHTFITMEQDQGNGTIITLSVGLYPEDFATPCHQIDGGAYNDDGGHQFDVSVTWPITDWGFNILISDLISHPFAPLYNLSGYNCATFAIEKLNQLGLNIPASNVVSLDMPPPTGCHVEGLAPSQLGQDIRNNYPLPAGATKNTTGGHAPSSTCH
ncbi:MAG: hypothetical protein ACKVUS_12645 [Saprospiraceae bacterium]